LEEATYSQKKQLVEEWGIMEVKIDRIMYLAESFLNYLKSMR
jgi:hypothetical protein